MEVIGRSVEGRPITVERVGSGPIDVLIVGGIHGGYEANSIVLARRGYATRPVQRALGGPQPKLGRRLAADELLGQHRG